jgi:membrane fusion protein, multidrug efflux system
VAAYCAQPRRRGRDLQPPIPVIAATVQKQNFPIVLTSIGNVAALNSATVRSMVTEQIISIDFKEGQDVKKGQILAQLDPTSYQSQLDQAEANLARDKAHLENGRIDLGRDVPLAKKGAIPEEEAATQQAKVNEEEAVVKADQAAVSYAKTQLGYTKLLAPFDGVAGLRLLDVGNIIHASSSRGDPTEPNALVVINQVQPISVMVALAASGMPEVREALLSVVCVWPGANEVSVASSSIASSTFK